MSKWLWIAPVLLAVGCSKNPSASQPLADNAQTVHAAAPAPPPSGADPVPVAPPPAADPAPAPEEAVPVPVASATVIPSGTPLRVRIDQTISTRRNMGGDRFSATLADPVVVGGRDVLPRGTRLHGHVLVARASGRLKGRAQLVLALDSFERDGHRYRIETAAATRVSKAHKKRNLIAIGGGSGIGGAIGAIAGGGAGALIGAGAGAAAGTVGAAVTGKKEVTIPAESVLRFTLGAPVRV